MFINKQRIIIALDRQGTQQQRPGSRMVTPPSMQVNTMYMNSTKGTGNKCLLVFVELCLKNNNKKVCLSFNKQLFNQRETH